MNEEQKIESRLSWIKGAGVTIGSLVVCVGLVMIAMNWFSGCGGSSVARSRVNSFTYGETMKLKNGGQDIKEYLVALPDSMHRGDVELLDGPNKFMISPASEGTDGYVRFYRTKMPPFHLTWEARDSIIYSGREPDLAYFYVYGEGSFKIRTTNRKDINP